MFYLLWAGSFAIAWFGAWAVGKSWAESKHDGGVAHLVNQIGWGCSTTGFTWCYMSILTPIVAVVPWSVLSEDEALQGETILSQANVDWVHGLGLYAFYVTAIGVLLALTIDMWSYSWRRSVYRSTDRDRRDSYFFIFDSHCSHYHSHSSGFGGGLFGSSSSNSSGGDGKGKGALILFAIAVLCIVGGYFTTKWIVESTAQNHALAILRERGANDI